VFKTPYKNYLERGYFVANNLKEENSNSSAFDNDKRILNGIANSHFISRYLWNTNTFGTSMYAIV